MASPFRDQTTRDVRIIRRRVALVHGSLRCSADPAISGSTIDLVNYDRSEDAVVATLLLFNHERV